MAGAEHPGRHPTLHERGELEQAQGVGDLGPRPADPASQLLLRAAEVVEQLLIGRGLLEGVELAAVEVLQEGVSQEVVLLGDLDDRRDDVLARLARGTPAPLAHDELEAGLPVLGLGRDPSHDDRLEDADLADRVHELGQLVLVEDRARLARVRADVVERDLGEFRPGNGAQPGVGGRGTVVGWRLLNRRLVAVSARCSVRARQVAGVGPALGCALARVVHRHGRRRRDGVLVTEEHVDRAVGGRAGRDQRPQSTPEGSTLLAHADSSVVFGVAAARSASSMAASR
jgi:hypothetical protein